MIEEEIPFKKHIAIMESNYIWLKALLKHEESLKPTEVYDNAERIKNLREEIAAYEYFFPFF